jgi:hypothetical protein
MTMTWCARVRTALGRRLPGGGIVPALCGLLLALVACKDEPPAGPSVGTNSNWLRACTTSAECGDLPACECGACTAPCADDGECDAIEDARCALGQDPAAWAECESRSPQLAAGLCLPRCDPGSCGDGQACVSGACVLAPLPEVPFCADVMDWDGGVRTREEDLLALLQDRRVAGGAACPEGAAAPAPALRFDPRLVCAARVWAREIDESGDAAAQDSQGRDGGDRVRAAGYSPRQWWESYTFDTSSAARTLDVMLSDGASCARLTDPLYTDVGVGGFGDTLVVTIATQ